MYTTDYKRDLRRDVHYKRLSRRGSREFLLVDPERQYFADNYSCWPPPLFIPIVTFLETCFYLYNTIQTGDLNLRGSIPANSLLIYRPDKRIQIWRFILYMFLHAGWVHLFFNMLVQIVVGIPLEMVHGSCRIAAVYMGGILAGSLGTSVFDMKAVLVGASGGVYALLAAHVANIILNYYEMELGILKIVAVLFIAGADLGFSIWDRYTSDSGLGGVDHPPPVAYVSHLVGAFAGLTVGLLVLKTFDPKFHTNLLWWLALCVAIVSTTFAVLWNIFYY